MVNLPGFPKPLMSGPLYDALRTTTATNGQPLPIHADREGLVWAGRTMLNICLDLGIEPKIDVVDDGYAAAVAELATRELSVLETADLVAAVHAELSAKFALREDKWSQEVSSWFKSQLGKERGFSPRQVENYMRVARATPAQRQCMAGAHSLHAAIAKLEPRQVRRAMSIPHRGDLNETMITLTQLLSQLEHCDDEQIVLLQGIRCLIDTVLSDNGLGHCENQHVLNS